MTSAKLFDYGATVLAMFAVGYFLGVILKNA